MINRPSTEERRQLLSRRASLCTAPLVMYGDSLTHYWEKEGRLAWEKYLAPLKAAAFGIEGDCTNDLKERLEQGELNMARDPSAVMLLVGTNNTTANWGKEPVETTLAGIRELAEMILNHFPLTKLYIQKIFPRGRARKNAVRSKGERINAELEQWDLPRTTILSHGDFLLLDDGRINPEYTTDYIHLTEKGYEEWGQLLARDFSFLSDQK